MSLVFAIALVGTACGGSGATATTASPPATWYSMAEKAELIVACVRDRGFDAEVVNGIGVMLIYGEQPEATERAHTECSEEIDANYPDPPRLSDEEMYEALLATAECLRGQGISVSQPPTFDSWVDDRSWTPYTDVVQSGADFWAIHRVCPQPGAGLTPTTDGSP